MTILKVLRYGNPVLRSKAKDVGKISKKIRILVENMLDTMYTNNGVGLAAPQIGEGLRIFVIDVSKQDEPYNPIVFINPKILKREGAICVKEGCLSFPEAFLYVKRYKDVKIKALDINGRPFIMEASDGELLSYAIQHEFDHLDGILFIDHSRNIFETTKVLEEYNLPQLEADKLLVEKDLEDIILANELASKDGDVKKSEN